MDLHPYIDKFVRRLAEVESALSDPKAFDNPQKAQELSKEYARLKELAAFGRGYRKAIEDLAANRALLQSEPAESEMAIMAKEDVARLEGEVQRFSLELQRGIIPPDPADSRNTIIEIRAGAAAASRPSSRPISTACTRVTPRAANGRWTPWTPAPPTWAGSRRIIFSVTGTDVYKRLKYESGVHRVQRVPATEAQGRIHTSTATVAVLPEAQEVDIDIKPEELDITCCRASGPGGQGVNTTDSAVQIVHKPTGLTVRIADQRSQQKNKAQAMTVLRSRLLERKIAEEDAKYAAQRKAQVGTGERNERIRTYNFPQNRVTDHRIEVTLYNLPTFIEGDLDCLLEPLMNHALEERLAALNV